MAIKKFFLSTGDGDVEETELDSDGQRTIGYDDVAKRVQLSSAYIVGNLYVSGSIYGNLSGSLSGNVGGGSGGISSVSASGNLTGSGLSDNPLTLKSDISLNSVTASFNGDGTGISNIVSKVKFTRTATAVSVGDVVSIGSSGLAKCSKTSDLLSNGIGVVYSSGSGEVFVQTSGEATVTITGVYSTGSILYIGANGVACTYDQIASGEYITQIGIASGNGAGKLIIQPRIFGQKG